MLRVPGAKGAAGESSDVRDSQFNSEVQLRETRESNPWTAFASPCYQLASDVTFRVGVGRRRFRLHKSLLRRRTLYYGSYVARTREVGASNYAVDGERQKETREKTSSSKCENRISVNRNSVGVNTEGLSLNRGEKEEVRSIDHFPVTEVVEEIVILADLQAEAFESFADYIYHVSNSNYLDRIVHTNFEVRHAPLDIGVTLNGNSKQENLSFTHAKIIPTDQDQISNRNSIKHAHFSYNNSNNQVYLNTSRSKVKPPRIYCKEKSSYATCNNAVINIRHTPDHAPWQLRPLTPEALLSVYEVAVEMRCPDLRSLTASLICACPMTPAMILRAWLMSTRANHPLTEFETLFRHFVLRDFERISRLPTVYDIDPNLLLPLLADNGLNVADEVIVLRFILQWACKSNSRRLDDVVDCVRFEQIKKARVVEEINVVRARLQPDDRMCLERAWRASQVLYSLLRNGMTVELPRSLEKMRPRVCPNQVFLLGGWHHNHPIKEFDSLDPRCSTWFHLPCSSRLSLPESSSANRCSRSGVTKTPPRHAHPSFHIESRAYHAVAAMNGWVYVVGGTRDGRACLDTAFRLSADTGECGGLRAMRERRCYVTAVACVGAVYALGGYDGSTRMRTVERYAPEWDEWTNTASMITRRSDASCDCLNGLIYVAGGYVDGSCLSETECYNPTTDQWTSLARMTEVRSGLSLVACDGNIYAVGGYNGDNRMASLERYDPASNYWKPMSPMLTTRSNFAIFLLDGYIYVVGGFDGNFTTRLSEKYDPATDTWSQAPPLLTAKSACKAVVVDGIQRPERFGYYGDEVSRDLRRSMYIRQTTGYRKNSAIARIQLPTR